MSKPAVTRNMWAPIRDAVRGPDWVCAACIRYTRRDAKAAFLAAFSPEPRHQRQALKGVRFARVTITEDVKP